MGDFTPEEIEDITAKFAVIGFKCRYISYNKLSVSTDYKDYNLSVHRRKNDEYYFFVYRPAIDTFITSSHIQKCTTMNHKSIESLIEHVEDIKNIIIRNSVAVKDILTDMNQQISLMYNVSSSIETEEFISDLRQVAIQLNDISKSFTSCIYR